MYARYIFIIHIKLDYVQFTSSSKALFSFSSSNVLSNCCALKRFSIVLDVECTSMTRVVVSSQNSANEPNSSSNMLSFNSFSDVSNFFLFLIGSFNVSFVSNPRDVNSVSILDLNHHGNVRKCLM